jgi:hypothetical protein
MPAKLSALRHVGVELKRPPSLADACLNRRLVRGDFAALNRSNQIFPARALELAE